MHEHDFVVVRVLVDRDSRPRQERLGTHDERGSRSVGIDLNDELAGRGRPKPQDFATGRRQNETQRLSAYFLGSQASR